MPGSPSCVPYAPQGVKGFDGDDDDGDVSLKPIGFGGLEVACWPLVPSSRVQPRIFKGK